MSGLSTRDVWKSDAVEVVFEKTGVRRYAVSVHRPGLPVLRMDPAPGFDRYFPHDMQHLIVEEQLGLRDGIFGRLANGGTASTFRPDDPDGIADDRARSRYRRPPSSTKRSFECRWVAGFRPIRASDLHRLARLARTLSRGGTASCGRGDGGHSSNDSRRHVRGRADATHLRVASNPRTGRCGREAMGVAVTGRFDVHSVDTFERPRLPWSEALANRCPSRRCG